MKKKCTFILLAVIVLLILLIKLNFIVPNVIEKRFFKLSDDNFFKAQNNALTNFHCMPILKAKYKNKQSQFKSCRSSNKHYNQLSAQNLSVQIICLYKISNKNNFCRNTSNIIDINRKQYSSFRRPKNCWKPKQIPSYLVTFMVAITLVKLVVVVLAYQQLLHNGYIIVQNLYHKHLRHLELLVCSRPYQLKSGHGVDAEENYFGFKNQNHQGHPKRHPLKEKPIELQVLKHLNKFLEIIVSNGQKCSAHNTEEASDQLQQYSLIDTDKTKMFALKTFCPKNQLYHQQLPLMNNNFYQHSSYKHHRIKCHNNHQLYEYYFSRNICCFVHKDHYNQGFFHQLEMKFSNDSYMYSKSSILCGKSYFENRASRVFLQRNVLAKSVTASSTASFYSRTKKPKQATSVYMTRMIGTSSGANHIEDLPNYHATVQSLTSTSLSSTICCWKTSGNRKRRKRKFSFIWDKNEYIRNCEYLVRGRCFTYSSCCFCKGFCDVLCECSEFFLIKCCQTCCCCYCYYMIQIDNLKKYCRIKMHYKMYKNEYNISSHNRVLSKNKQHQLSFFNISRGMKSPSSERRRKWCIEPSHHEESVDVNGSNLLRSLSAVKELTSSVHHNRSNKRKLKKNLVWLFIGLVWLEGPKLINCSISHSNNDVTSLNGNETTNKIDSNQSGNGDNNSNSSETSSSSNGSRSSSNTNGPGTNERPAAAENKVQKGKNSSLKMSTPEGRNKDFPQKKQFSNRILTERPISIKEQFQYQTISQSEGPQHHEAYTMSRSGHSSTTPNRGSTPLLFVDEKANRAQSDISRLESIKRQILTKLGLTEKPNVTHPLPKQFIWDTIYRADGIRSVSEFDFNDNNHRTQEHMRLATAVLEPPPLLHTGQHLPKENKDTETVRLHSRTAILSHNEREKEVSTGGNMLVSNWKLFNITSEQADKIHLKFLRKYRQHQERLRNNKHSISRNKNRFSDPDYVEGDDFFGSTQEIITFAEKGKVYKKHRLVEFSPPSNKIPKQKLQIRNAEIHIRIEKVSTISGKPTGQFKHRNHHKLKSSVEPSLKIWIFQLIGSDFSSKGFDQVARLCTSLSVNHNVLGWQKLDITETVQFWYGKHQKDKLRLLIDCTGCGNRYILHLFDRKFHDSLFSPPPPPPPPPPPITTTTANNSRQTFNDTQEQNYTTYTNKSSSRTEHSDSNESLRYLYQSRQYNHHRYRRKNRTIHHMPKQDTSSEKSIELQLKEQTKVANHPHQSPWLKSRTYRKSREINNAHISSQEHQLEGISYEVAAEFHLEDRLNPNRPFLVLHTEPSRSRRVRRRAVDCSGAIHGQCCKESFYVSFKALGWDDWIIAPRGYFANYCRGDCTGPYRTPDTFQTFHAHFIEEYRKMGLLNGMQPCCAPVKFSSMSLIYYGDDGIIKRDLPKMVVDECGCP